MIARQSGTAIIQLLLSVLVCARPSSTTTNGGRTRSSITNIATVTAANGDPSPANNTATFVTSIGRMGCDVNGDGKDEIIVGSGPGGGPFVQVFSLSGLAVILPMGFYAYDPAFPGGITVACGDIDGDGLADIVTGAGPGGGPHVRAFSLVGGVHEIASFYAYDPAFSGGVDVAVGDLNGDGVKEIITGAGPGGGPHVRAFSFDEGALTEVASFYAYDPRFPGGVHVAAGDTNGDGIDELITGAGPSGGPHVCVIELSGGTLRQIASFFAYDPAFRGGVWVAAADIDGDGTLEIVTGDGPSGAAQVRVLHLDGGTLTDVARFPAYTPRFTPPGGIRVASASPHDLHGSIVWPSISGFISRKAVADETANWEPLSAA